MNIPELTARRSRSDFECFPLGTELDAVLQLARYQGKKRLDYGFLDTRCMVSAIGSKTSIRYAHFHAEALISREISVEFSRKNKLLGLFDLMIEPRIACDHTRIRIDPDDKRVNVNST